MNAKNVEYFAEQLQAKQDQAKLKQANFCAAEQNCVRPTIKIDFSSILEISKKLTDSISSNIDSTDLEENTSVKQTSKSMFFTDTISLTKPKRYQKLKFFLYMAGNV